MTPKEIPKFSVSLPYNRLSTHTVYVEGESCVRGMTLPYVHFPPSPSHAYKVILLGEGSGMTLLSPGFLLSSPFNSHTTIINVGGEGYDRVVAFITSLPIYSHGTYLVVGRQPGPNTT